MSNFIVKVVAIITLFLPFSSFSDESILEPKLLSKESYSETYTTLADLSDGTYIVIQLGVSNVGPGDGHGFCQLLIAPNGQPPQYKKITVRRKQWAYNTQLRTLKIGNCEAHIDYSTQSFHVSANLDSFRATLHIDAVPKKFSSPYSPVTLKKDFYEPEILIPWAKVRASYQLASGHNVALDGYSFADHSRSTILPGKLAKKWVRFRAVNALESTLLLARFPPKVDIAEGWTWHQNDNAALSFSSLRLKPITSESGTQWHVDVEDTHGQHTIESKYLIFRHAPLEQSGLAGDVVAKVIGNPVTRIYRGTLKKSNGITVKGIMEVTISDE